MIAHMRQRDLSSALYERAFGKIGHGLSVASEFSGSACEGSAAKHALALELT